MITAELYKSGRPLVILEKSRDTNFGAWARLQEAMGRAIVGGSDSRLDVRADVFMAELAAVREVRQLFGEKFEPGTELRSQLQLLAEDRRNREIAIAGQSNLALADLEPLLDEAGFIRTLKSFQLENLLTIQRLPHGADFSVPGAGKTTVALASFALNRAKGLVDRLLVVGPIAAFQAWKEDSAACITPTPYVFVHLGRNTRIPDRADIVLTNYNRVASDYDGIRKFVADKPTQVILDEAHRIKRGEGGVHGRAVLDLAYAARRRDVLTGTPAPQGAFDLIAPIRFLYPGQDHQILPSSAYFERDGRDETVLAETSEAIAKYFVRTPKSRLALPPTQFDVVRKPMPPIQKAVYEALLGRYRGEFNLELADRRMFDRAGRITMYLLEAATNPMLLTAGSDLDDQQGFVHPPLEVRGDEPLSLLLRSYREHEIPWKYQYVHDIVKRAHANAEKIIIWSTFVRNIKLLAALLASFNPAIVHGGIPPIENAPPGTISRDAELDRFRTDSECSVLLVNPAACGEGVSLHHWCHHAVYLDRTFNAGHFLQSQDRIHRLGLPDGVVTRFTLLVSEGTVDEIVDSRLRDKVAALSRLMNDPNLVQVALPESDLVNDKEPAALADDLGSVLQMLTSHSV